MFLVFFGVVFFLLLLFCLDFTQLTSDGFLFFVFFLQAVSFLLTSHHTPSFVVFLLFGYTLTVASFNTCSQSYQALLLLWVFDK